MRAGLAAIGLFLAGPAAAQSVSVSGELAVLSDYIDRGLSLPDEDPSGSGALYLDHSSGAYAGLVLARTDELRGNDLELEGVVGYTMGLEAYELDLSAAVDSFHGADSFAYPEFLAKLSRDLGLVYAAAGLAYAPDGRWLVRDEDTVYSFLELEVPIPRLPWLTATGHAGFSAITDAEDRADWGLGLAAGYEAFEFSVGYRDTDSSRAIGDGRVVGAIRVFF